jgi:ubiquitin carboxyl-terminal hydrolase L5
MMAYETSQIEFSLLSVVRDPSSGLQAELARNVKALNTVWAAFELASSSPPGGTTLPDRTDFPDLDSVVWSAASEYGLNEAAIETAKLSEALMFQIAQCSCPADFSALLDLLSSDQFRIRGGIVEEKHSRASEEDLAARRRHDYGPAVYRWLQMLHKKGELKSLLEEAQVK